MASESRIFARTETRSLLFQASEPPPHRAFELEPTAALRGSVERIRWGREAFREPVLERILPDGAVHLVFDLGSRVSATAVGACCEPKLLELSGDLEHVGVELRAGGAAALLGVPAAELNGREVPLEELWGSRARSLIERLGDAPLEVRGFMLARELAPRVSERGATSDRRAREAVRCIVQARGSLKLRMLRDSLGVGERRLEQLFRSEVGLTPKALCRVVRLRATLEALTAARRPPWAVLAQQYGYYDQAHLVNEFRALCGVTPAQLGKFGFFQYGSPADD